MPTTENRSPISARVEEFRDGASLTRSLLFDDKRVTFTISGAELAGPLETFDFAALALVFHAMRAGRPLHIAGPLSLTMARNIESFQEAWVAWLPRVYQRVPLSADRWIEARSGETRRDGVFAFSGGVDSTYALLSHLSGGAGYRTVNPAVAMMVWGFDIPLNDDAGFSRAHESAHTMLQPLSIPLAVVRTDWRDVLSPHWEMEFCAGLAACLHQFSGAQTHGVLGADEDLAHLALPWGSNPITNPMLSGGQFEILTEGAGATRTQRCALIAQSPQIASQLRVCWEGSTGGNCGVCEKCIRTKLNFMANGLEPVCFDRPPNAREILTLYTRNLTQLAYLDDILETAGRNGITDPWVRQLAAVVAGNRGLVRVRGLARAARDRLRG